MVFLDHLKPLYTIDLKVMEEEGLVGPVSRAGVVWCGVVWYDVSGDPYHCVLRSGSGPLSLCSPFRSLMMP